MKEAKKEQIQQRIKIKITVKNLGMLFSNFLQKTSQAIRGTAFNMTVFFLWLLLADNVAAVTVSVKGADATVALGIKKSLEDAVNPFIDKLFDGDLKKTYGLFANANINAGQGMNADYANNFKYFSLGVGVSASAPVSLPYNFIKGKGLKNIAGAAHINLQAGLDMGFTKIPILKDMKFFANLFTINIASIESFSNKFKSFGVAKARITSVGFYVAYPLVKEKDFGNPNVFNINGVYVGGGFTYKDNRFAYEKEAKYGGSKAFPVNVRFDNWAITFPLELYTSIKVLYVISFYTGIGLDLNFGATKITMKDFDIDDSGSTYTVSADFGKAAMPHTVDLRAFGGIQFNMGPGHIVIGFAIASTSNIEATVALRIAM